MALGTSAYHRYVDRAPHRCVRVVSVQLQNDLSSEPGSSTGTATIVPSRVIGKQDVPEFARLEAV